MARITTGDVIVIGAGIVGAACAFRLSERGLRTILIEAAEMPASGSTGRSAAGVRVQFLNETNVRLSWESIQEYRAFEELFGEDAAYQPLGYLFLVPPEDWEDHLAGVELQRRVGVPVEVLQLSQAQELVPFSTGGLHAATYGPADGVIDPHRVTLTYLRLARELGCLMLMGTPLTAASSAGGTWRVSTPTGVLEAPFVVNAAGAWAREVGRRSGLEIPVDPVLRNIYTTSPSFAGVVYPLTVDLLSGFYLRSEGARILMGRSNSDQPAGFHEGVDWAWLEPTLGSGLARFPWLRAAALDRKACWWGYYEVTPDHCPILGAMPEADGWVNACGFSGHGVQQAAAVGKVIAEEIADGRARSIDIDPFRYERLGRHEAVEKRLEKHIV